MRLFLGVDGGGTNCRVRLVDHTGAALAETHSGPANIATDTEAALGNILSASTEALHRAGLTAEAFGRVHACLGLAGVNISGAAERVQDRLPFASTRLVTDAVTTTHGALAGQDGIVAAIGTGSVFASLRGGVYRQMGGWGHVLGDQGSGAVLGRMLLARVLLGHDGLVPMTPLLSRVMQGHGPADRIAALSLSAQAVEFGRFAPEVFAADDPAATAILSEAATGVAAYIERMQAEAPLPVTWVGGLGTLWAARIGKRWPERPPQGSALDGAVALAMDQATVAQST